MEIFNKGERVEFRESVTGPVELGTVDEVIPPDDHYKNGGLYVIALDDGTGVEAWVDELTRIPRSGKL